MMKLLESIQAAVPAGKAFVWIFGGMVTAFAAGVGVTFGFGETSRNVEAIPALIVQVSENSDAIESVSSRQDQILCLVMLTATGDELTPLQVRQECP